MANEIIMKKTKRKRLRFIDFCAGIGGGRVALEELGMQCVGFAEIDKNAARPYKFFLGKQKKIMGI